jgi:hypothetical protein
VSGATMHLLSVALCVTRAPVYDAAGCALTVRRAAQRAEDRTSLVTGEFAAITSCLSQRDLARHFTRPRPVIAY